MPRRLDQYRADEIEPPLPPLTAPSVFDRLVELGLAEAGSMGRAPLAWTTIDAWQRVTGVRLSPWEARLLRRLSVEYLAESHAAEDWARPAPWRRELTETEQDAERRQHLAALGHIV